MHRVTYHLIAVLAAMLAFVLATWIIIPAIQHRGLGDTKPGILLAWMGLVCSPLLAMLVVELISGRAWGLAFRLFNRKEQPGWYWFCIGAQLLMILLVVLTGVRALWG